MYQLDLSILNGIDASTLAKFSGAFAFASKIKQAATAEGILLTQVYVTGHSLGGTLSA